MARRQSGINRPLRVAVAGLSLRYPNTGTARYAREVIAALAERSDIRATVVLGQDAERPVTARGRVGVVYPPFLPFRLGNHGNKLYWEQVGFRWAAIRTRAEVWYSPHFAMPLWPSRPTVLSVHDMIPYTMPEYAGTRATRAYFRLQALAAKQATSVVTLSAHAKTEIERLFGIDSGRVHVVMPGVDGAFSPDPDPVARARARRRYGLGDRYMLYVGGADARKNIGVLLRAMSLLTNHDDVPELVVVVGEPKPGQDALFPDWRAQARTLGLGDRVRFITLVAEEDLAEVYRGADVFCFPSRAEGFGLNPLEAMACGTAVISSNATSLPEAVGDAGVLVAPDDADGWARAILQVSGKAALRADLERRGLERAATFQWAETGARVVKLIRAARS